MSETVMEKMAKYFNEGNIDEIIKGWHDDIQVFDLKTEKLLISGKENLKENDLPYVLDESITFNVDRVLKFENIEIGYFTVTNKGERIQVFELEDGLIKNTWFTRIPKEK